MPGFDPASLTVKLMQFMMLMSKERAFMDALARERDFDDEVIATCRVRVANEHVGDHDNDPAASEFKKKNHDLILAASAMLVKVSISSSSRMQHSAVGVSFSIICSCCSIVRSVQS